MRSFILVTLGWVLLQQTQCSSNDRSNCRPFTSSVCQGLGYTSSLHPTGAPGFILQQVAQIVDTNCSPDVKTLMCRVALPECGSDDTRSKPCRSLCEKVKTDCESKLRARRLFWPTKLQCETLPESNCVQVGVQR